MSRPIERIVIHHSASVYGDVATIREWHQKRGFRDIGYHWVILNGYRAQNSTYSIELDGLSEAGRPINDDHIIDPWEVGAHAKGANLDSIGVCLIGRGPEFSMAQFGTLTRLVTDLCVQHSLAPMNVYGHKQVGTTPTACPGFPINEFRSVLRLTLGS